MGLAKICTNGYYAVDDIPIYVPSAVNISHENIVTKDSGRVESGLMHVTFVRGDVRTVSFEYDELTGAEKEYMVNLTQGRVFNLTYYDNGIKTIRGYVGRSSEKQKDLSVYVNEGGRYQNYKFDVVEM